MAKLAVRDAAQMGCEYHAQGMVGTLCVQRTEKAAGGKQSAGSQVTCVSCGAYLLGMGRKRVCEELGTCELLPD